MTTSSKIPWTKLLAFAIGLLVIHSALFAFYARVIRPNHKVTKSDILWWTSPKKVDLVFLGDSHPRSAIDPRLIGPNVVNLATGGEHYTKNYYRFRKLQEVQPRQVKAVVIPLDPQSFTSWHADAFAPEYVWGRYIDYLELGRLRHQRWIFAGRWAKSRYFPYAGELRTLNQLRSKRFGFAESLATGNFGRLSPERRVGAGIDAAEEHFGAATIVDPHQKLGFDLLLDWLRDEGIQAVCLSYPLTSAYLDAAKKYQGDPRGVVQRAVIDELPTRHPEVIHLDYTDHLRGQPDLFADPHHLNVPGRRIFTREIHRRFAELGLLDPPTPRQ